MFAGSFVVQSHVGYLPATLAVSVVASAFLVVRCRDAGFRRKNRWWAVGALGTGLLVWLPPLLEEMRGSPGNLSLLLAFSSRVQAEHSASEALAIVARQAAVAPVKIVRLLMPFAPEPGPGVEKALLGALALYLVVTLAWAARRRDRPVAALVLVCGAALLASFFSVTRIVDEIHDYLVVWIGVVGAVGWMVAGAWLAKARSAVLLLVGAAGLGVSCLTVAASYPTCSGSARAGTNPRVEKLSTELVAYLRKERVAHPLIRPLSDGTWVPAAGVLLELDREGIPFSVEKGWEFMFGRWRLADGREDGTVLFTDDALARSLLDQPGHVTVSSAEGTVVLFTGKRRP